ncbi:hypothetical protein [Nostoc flagelliforme]|uniref:hypothetical protein n=1 Tax=Nostoc flagelliforme TaxID=1306274 RepID=UPI0030CE60D1
MISVPTSVEQIEQIAQREDWLLEYASFGFDFILFWVENRLLIELLTPEMTAQYLAFMQRENLRKYFVLPDSYDSPKG